MAQPRQASRQKYIVLDDLMVRAIFRGDKTQFRIPIEIQPATKEHKFATLSCTTDSQQKKYEGQHHWIIFDGATTTDSSPYFKSPHGYADDQVAVKEPFREASDERGGKSVIYQADEDQIKKAYRSAERMPERYIRTNLILVNVRIENLHDISDTDCIAEGIMPTSLLPANLENYEGLDLKKRFKYQWEKNPDNGSWDLNPKVWVYEFKIATERDIRGKKDQHLDRAG